MQFRTQLIKNNKTVVFFTQALKTA
uniref:Uncharacterized protein n=1 Tax=Anguilla anguilla TaxID=7936 RepID=A0A0E9S2Y6_ANGAN